MPGTVRARLHNAFCRFLVKLKLKTLRMCTYDTIALDCAWPHEGTAEAEDWIGQLGPH